MSGACILLRARKWEKNSRGLKKLILNNMIRSLQKNSFLAGRSKKGSNPLGSMNKQRLMIDSPWKWSRGEDCSLRLNLPALGRVKNSSPCPRQYVKTMRLQIVTWMNIYESSYASRLSAFVMKVLTQESFAINERLKVQVRHLLSTSYKLCHGFTGIASLYSGTR